jgi:hypothetical protein
MFCRLLLCVHRSTGERKRTTDFVDSIEASCWTAGRLPLHIHCWMLHIGTFIISDLQITLFFPSFFIVCSGLWQPTPIYTTLCYCCIHIIRRPADCRRSPLARERHQYRSDKEKQIWISVVLFSVEFSPFPAAAAV